MRINHNIGALNAWRNLTKTNRALDRSLERLSSGLRINRAADDAAGLAISEKMRAQVNGLNTAGRNAQDAISLIQTGEGALEESHAILQRVRELAVQASSDTMTAEDRAKLQSEIDELTKEIGRIGQTTEFNTKKLLDGSFDGKFQIGANAGQNLQVSIGDMRGMALGIVGEGTFEDTGTLDDTNGDWSAVDGEVLSVVTTDEGIHQLVDADDVVVADDSAASGDGKTFVTTDSGDTLDFLNEVVQGTVTIDVANTAGTADTAQGVNAELEAGSYTIDVAEAKILDADGNEVAADGDADGTFTDAGGNTLYTVDTANMSGTVALSIGGVNITATDAIATMDAAIDDVATQRSSLGAVQNRLEHTINNLSTAAENLTAAEARIRDVDMAKEMTAFTRAQILSQSGTAMLAQANIRPQSVLSLLG